MIDSLQVPANTAINKLSKAREIALKGIETSVTDGVKNDLKRSLARIEEAIELLERFPVLNEHALSDIFVDLVNSGNNLKITAVYETLIILSTVNIEIDLKYFEKLTTFLTKMGCLRIEAHKEPSSLRLTNDHLNAFITDIKRLERSRYEALEKQSCCSWLQGIWGDIKQDDFNPGLDDINALLKIAALKSDDARRVRLLSVLKKLGHEISSSSDHPLSKGDFLWKIIRFFADDLSDKKQQFLADLLLTLIYYDFDKSKSNKYQLVSILLEHKDDDRFFTDGYTKRIGALEYKPEYVEAALSLVKTYEIVKDKWPRYAFMNAHKPSNETLDGLDPDANIYVFLYLLDYGIYSYSLCNSISSFKLSVNEIEPLIKNFVNMTQHERIDDVDKQKALFNRLHQDADFSEYWQAYLKGVAQSKTWLNINHLRTELIEAFDIKHEGVLSHLIDYNQQLIDMNLKVSDIFCDIKTMPDFVSRLNGLIKVSHAYQSSPLASKFLIKDMIHEFALNLKNMDIEHLSAIITRLSTLISLKLIDLNDEDDLRILRDVLQGKEIQADIFSGSAKLTTPDCVIDLKGGDKLHTHQLVRALQKLCYTIKNDSFNEMAMRQYYQDKANPWIKWWELDNKYLANTVDSNNFYSYLLKYHDRFVTHQLTPSMMPQGTTFCERLALLGALVDLWEASPLHGRQDISLVSVINAPNLKKRLEQLKNQKELTENDKLFLVYSLQHAGNKAWDACALLFAMYPSANINWLELANRDVLYSDSCLMLLEHLHVTYLVSKNTIHYVLQLNQKEIESFGLFFGVNSLYQSSTITREMVDVILQSKVVPQVDSKRSDYPRFSLYGINSHFLRRQSIAQTDLGKGFYESKSADALKMIALSSSVLSNDKWLYQLLIDTLYQYHPPKVMEAFTTCLMIYGCFGAKGVPLENQSLLKLHFLDMIRMFNELGFLGLTNDIHKPKFLLSKDYLPALLQDINQKPSLCAKLASLWQVDTRIEPFPFENFNSLIAMDDHVSKTLLFEVLDALMSHRSNHQNIMLSDDSLIHLFSLFADKKQHHSQFFIWKLLLNPTKTRIKERIQSLNMADVDDAQLIGKCDDLKTRYTCIKIMLANASDNRYFTSDWLNRFVLLKDEKQASTALSAVATFNALHPYGNLPQHNERLINVDLYRDVINCHIKYKMALYLYDRNVYSYELLNSLWEVIKNQYHLNVENLFQTYDALVQYREPSWSTQRMLTILVQYPLLASGWVAYRASVEHPWLDIFNLPHDIKDKHLKLLNENQKAIFEKLINCNQSLMGSGVGVEHVLLYDDINDILNNIDSLSRIATSWDKRLGSIKSVYEDIVTYYYYYSSSFISFECALKPIQLLMSSNLLNPENDFDKPLCDYLLRARQSDNPITDDEIKACFTVIQKHAANITNKPEDMAFLKVLLESTYRLVALLAYSLLLPHIQSDEEFKKQVYECKNILVRKLNSSNDAFYLLFILRICLSANDKDLSWLNMDNLYSNEFIELLDYLKLAKQMSYYTMQELSQLTPENMIKCRDYLKKHILSGDSSKKIELSTMCQSSSSLTKLSIFAGSNRALMNPDDKTHNQMNPK